MPRTLARALLAAAWLIGAFSGPALAQYMYLDANGDGINTPADSLNASSTTTLTIYLDTSRDRNGSSQTCNSHTLTCGATASGAALDFDSYTILLAAPGGTVSWGTFVPADAAYTPAGGVKTTDHDASIDFRRAFGTFTPSGLLRIGSIPVTVLTGRPRVVIANHPIDADPYLPGTYFGTPHCGGLALGANTYVLGDTATACSGDWYDADGVGPLPPEIHLHHPAGTLIELLETCPQNDPAYASIRKDFAIRRNGVLVQDVPCSEPISQMPTDQYSDELIMLQGLRLMYYMDLGRSGHLPWTAGTLYDWLKSRLQGFDLTDNTTSYCCFIYPEGTFAEIETQDAFNRDFDRSWRGISGNIGLYAHEARHADGFIHANCVGSPVYGDLTYDESNLSPIGIQYWLEKSWLNGDLNVGYSCLDAATVNEIANWHLQSANSFIDLFCDNKPPLLDLPQHPGGDCLDVTAPTTETIDEGAALTFKVSAGGVGGGHIPLSMPAGAPAGATFADSGDNTGTFQWTPSFVQAGTYSATFRGTYGSGGVGTATTVIAVNNVNRAPTANPGGPYSGVAGVPVVMNGGSSSDPDGDALTFAWIFGDGSTGDGATPSHTYASKAGSPYTVTLTVSDGFLTGTAATTATVQDVVAATVFYPFNLNYIFPQILPTSVWIEPIGGSFAVSDVVLSSLSMIYNGVSIVTGCRSASGGDRNHNGVAEIRVCFARNDLKSLFASLPNGTSNVNVTVEGALMAGGRFQGTTQVHVIKLGFLGAGSLASVSPNPLNPQAKLTFVTTQPGVASVQVFDLNGRLVRNLMAQQDLLPGIHEVTVDGRNEQGNRLASGIYFYRVRSADGVSKGALAVLR